MMQPPIAPIGLEYVAASAIDAGIGTHLLDLCLADNPQLLLQQHFSKYSSTLIGISFRNVDDCFWPSAQWFVDDLAALIKTIRQLTKTPIAVGGAGFSIFPEQILQYSNADFGIRGDGEKSIVDLYHQLQENRDFSSISGLFYWKNNQIHSNKPASPRELSLPTTRKILDNLTYFKKGGQAGLETKRGCNRNCIYCAEKLSKGKFLRLRPPSEVAKEAQSLLSQGINVIHICDSEFNIPYNHAKNVCQEFIRQNLGNKLKWYTYMTVTPFDEPLADAMKHAGCAGINFTGDSASSLMLNTYRQPHTARDLANTVSICKQKGIKVMIDLMLGGPGETPETVAETINFAKKINPDCAGTALGIRIYPGTEIANIIEKTGKLDENPNIRRQYNGPIDLFKPTYYISSKLGNRPAALIRELIDNDKRFFEPASDIEEKNNASDHNYNDNSQLVEALAKGSKGAYWDILSSIRQ